MSGSKGVPRPGPEPLANVADHMLDLYFQEIPAEFDQVQDLFEHFHISGETTSRIETTLAAEIPPDLVSERGQMPLIDYVLDDILGVDVPEIEEEILSEAQELELEHPNEHLWLGRTDVWAGYGDIRDIITALDPTSSDVLADLCAGYGRTLMYTRFVTPASCWGIELVPHRVAAAQTIIDRLAMTDIVMHQGSVQEHDISDATVYFMYEPFTGST